MRKLVSDNIIDLLKADGKFPKHITVEEKEFFLLLKDKIIEDLDRVTKAQTVERKSDFIVDAYVGIRTYLEKASELTGKKSDDLIADRVGKVGALDKKIVLLEEDGNTEGLVPIVMEFGHNNNYPRLILGRNKEGQAFEWMSNGGKEAYEKMTANSEGVQKMHRAVLRKDIYEETKTK